jgi:hypothetical protein
MSAEGGEQPQNHKSDKPPRSKWRASESFFDLKLSHWIAILLTAALVYVGTSQLLVYRRQAKIMGTQANIATDQLSEMRAEQRPWVYADITPGEQIFWDQSGGLTFSVRFTWHNTGHLPASYVWPDMEGFLSGEEGKVGSQLFRPRQKKVCERKLEQPTAADQLGTTVFPGQTVDARVSFGISKAKIDAVRNLAIKTAGTDEFFMAPWGIGCIRYHSPDGGSHQTGFAFAVDRIETGKDGVFDLPKDPTVVPMAQLVIRPWIEGGAWYAD